MSDSYVRGFHTQAITDPAELEAVVAFRRRLRQVPTLQEWWGRLSTATPAASSDLQRDDVATAWRHLSSGVTYALNFASDNLRLIHELYSDDDAGPTPFVATYPLARAALEAASLALWILHPNGRSERIHRHLRNAAREVYEETSLRQFALHGAAASHRELGIDGATLGRGQREFKAWKAKHRSQIVECAERNTLPNPLNERRVGYGEIVAEATEATGLPGSHGQLVWMQISGLTHPSLMRASSTLSLEELGESDKPTVHVIMTSKTETVATAATAAVLMYREALKQYSLRIRPASAQSSASATFRANRSRSGEAH